MIISEKPKINEGVDTLIGSLALLRLNVLPNDYISSFIPFLATIFIEDNIDEVNVDNLITDFSERYGFIVPRMPMLAILKNCSKKGIIKREQDGRYYVQTEIAKGFCFSENARFQSKKYEQICAQFQAYVRNTRQIIISSEQAEQIILYFLLENSSKTVSFKLDHLKDPDSLHGQGFFLMGHFVKHCYENQPDVFEMIQNIASAHIIASALVSEIKDENDNAKQSSYNSLVLYLDTPIILRVLGLNTDEMQVSYEGLLNELKEHKNSFRIFQHTFDEIQGILHDCEKWIENPLYNAKYASEALRTFIAKKYSRSDIALFIETLEQKLNDYEIKIDDNDYYSKKYHYLQIEESPIREGIVDTYKENSPGFNEYAKTFTIECDVKSISAIFKLRNNNVCRSYRQAKYLFVTNNTSIAYISRKFTRDQNPSASYRIYPCVTDVLLGTSIWLSEPVQKIDSFSRIKLLADCSAAIMPSEGFISALSALIEKMYEEGKIEKDQYYILKRHAFDTHYLDNKTLTDENAVSDILVGEILEGIKAEMAAPYINTIKEKEIELNKLNEEKKKAEKEKILRIDKAKTYSKSYIKKLSKALIPVIIAASAFFIVCLTNLFTLSLLVKIIFNILSALIALFAALFLAIINNNYRNLKGRIEKKLEKQYLIKQYKKDLKSIDSIVYVESAETKGY